MKLRPRLTLFTVILVVLVVLGTSVSTIFSLRILLQKEMSANQATLFNNLKEACYDSLYLGDDLGIQVYSESLEKSVPGLAFAVFEDHSRGKIRIGGIESIERFNRINPTCKPTMTPVPDQAGAFTDDIWRQSQKWRVYCQEMELANIRGEKSAGIIYLGLNMDFLDFELKSVIGRMWETLMWSMLLVLIIGMGMALALSGRLTLPIRHLTEGAKAIGDGKLDTQIPIESTDELGFLAQEFNLMAVKLRELDQLKDDFISSVSHELRSPLAAISGYIELLRSKPLEQILPEKRAKALTIIQESTDRLTAFINDILDLAKLKSGHVELHKKQLNINTLADELIQLYHFLFEKKDIVCTVNIDNDVPIITADTEKIRQVLTNLVSNALKFTPSGGKIRISAKNQGEFIQVSVQDTGVGIPDSAKESIFERFKQVKAQSEKIMGHIKGTGLGLAIARGIVESHGGKIWIESEMQIGTKVHFTLPHRME